MRIAYEKKARARANRRAGEVRRALEERGTVAIRLTGNPGSGRTTLIERTARWCRSAGIPAAALTGAPSSRFDAARIEAAGLQAIPIRASDNRPVTAQSLLYRLGDEALAGVRLLLVETVPDLVSPVDPDLGETAKVAILSVPEGDDAPRKYPGIFERAQLLVVSKIDMLELTDFDVERAALNAREVSAELRPLPLSCRTGEGLDAWLDWLGGKLAALPPRRRRRAALRSAPTLSP